VHFLGDLCGLAVSMGQGSWRANPEAVGKMGWIPAVVIYSGPVNCTPATLMHVGCVQCLQKETLAVLVMTSQGMPDCSAELVDPVVPLPTG
jgi:hypothetical protein